MSKKNKEKEMYDILTEKEEDYLKKLERLKKENEELKVALLEINNLCCKAEGILR